MGNTSTIIKQIKITNKTTCISISPLVIMDKGEYTNKQGEIIDKSKFFLGYGVNFSYAKFDRSKRMNILLSSSEVGQLLFSLIKGKDVKFFHKCELSIIKGNYYIGGNIIAFNDFNLIELKIMLISTIIKTFDKKYNLKLSINELYNFIGKNKTLTNESVLINEPNEPVLINELVSIVEPKQEKNSNIIKNKIDINGGLKCSTPECSFVISALYVEAFVGYAENHSERFHGGVFCKRCQQTKI